MFTGLVHCTAKITAITEKNNIVTLSIQSEIHWQDISIGESISVSGVCLSVVACPREHIISFECMPETMQKTGFSKLAVGSYVNCERAMQMGDRFGGHMVQGHIDGVAVIDKIKTEGGSKRIYFNCKQILSSLLVPKGYICIDGVSLTIVDIKKNSFSIALIPQTLAKTIAGFYQISDIVNIEIDITTKTIQTYLKETLYENKLSR